MTTRDYEAPGIVVHWDSERCIHSERCTAGAPSVFDREARPWVDPTGAPVDELARVIDTCPSGALTYTRTDGAAPGPGGRPLATDEAPPDAVGAEDAVTPVVITPQRDGPLLVRGPVTLVRPDGGIEQLDRVTLCRCGRSGSKPRCDGSHARVGFRAPGYDGDVTR